MQNFAKQAYFAMHEYFSYSFIYFSGEIIYIYYTTSMISHETIQVL